MKKTKSALLHSVIALLLCISMFISSTFAWFTDTVSSGKNVITAGNLDLEMYWTDDLSSGQWYNVEENGHNTIFSYENWEPGYTDVKYIKLVNAGDLALNYELTLTPQNGVGKLAEVINVYFAEGGVAVQQRSDLQNLKAIGLLSNVLNGGATAGGTLLAADQLSPLHPSGEVVMTVAMNMLTTAGNDYQNEDAGEFTVTALATQAPYEADSFGNDYDANAELPGILTGGSATGAVTPVDGKVPAGGVSLTGGSISAYVPEGVVLEDGVNELTLTVTPMENTTSDITVVNNEILIPVDVHIQGVAATNNVPMVIDLGEVLPKYLNMGNYRLFHVENGANQEMTLVSDRANLTAHNQFTYDPLTGAVSVAMSTFSEVALLASPAKWEGGEDYSWYTDEEAKAAKSFTIANADQLYAFAKIVGGMATGIDGSYSFAGDTVTLLSDIDLNYGTVVNNDGAGKGESKKIFYPVGYYNDDDKANYDDKTNKGVTSGFYTFEGTFDGNGHTISNIYQNTWEMKGDHEWYDAKLQNYRDGMGLFGKVYGGTVKNLTVDNFESDGEITTTGCIAAYADGATFENIAITNCNPRVYNIGNGGIVGCVGWYAKEAGFKTTFTNITVDNSNKISALWGSYDVACGGIVGQYYPTSGQTSAGTPKNAGIHFENCHVAAQMDVYNDVCANYQYYAYRYAGMMIGSIRENLPADENGHIYPNMTGITASGCTVHYDTWNDYYYCELVANSKASYTHDHQFSRLEQVAKVEGTTITPLEGEAFTVPSSGRYNYVVVNGEHATENAICYHFVDGKVHNHDDYDGDGVEDYETVNGESIRVEDHRHIYLPFAQLFTGYGWGVTSRGLSDYTGVETMDIDSTNQKDSVEKFAAKDDVDLTGIQEGDFVSVGDLFSAIENPAVGIKNDTVMVAVTDLTNTGITADFARGTTWDEGKLTFNGINGIVKITIQDYYFCKPTSITVTVGEFKTTDRFAIKFPNAEKYLYRVGNMNPVNIRSLFELAEGAKAEDIGNVEITVADANEKLDVYTAGTGAWDSGTIDFADDYTGPVTVTISDNNFSTPVTLNVEVVDATNVKTYSELKNVNSVLLDDITMTANGKYSLDGNKTLYGNGFTFDVTAGMDSDTEGGYVGGNGTVWVRNSTLDNVRIVGEVYTKYGGTVKSEYNFPTVLVLGDSVIANSYISNGCAPVRVGSGCNIEIINSTLEGGIFANLDIRGGTVKLKDVTTINQSTTDGNSISNDEGVVGLGIVVYTGSTVTIDVDGLTQYNCISKNTTFKASDANTLKTVIFGNNYKNYQFSYDGATWVNTGILSMVAEVKGDNISKIDGYVGQDASISSYNGYVYAPTGLNAVASPVPYSSAGQYQIAPTYEFDYTSKNNIPQVSESNDYCYYEESTQKYLISFDDGESFTWDADILSITKGGATIVPSITVSNGATVNSDNTITFDTAGDYTVTYTYTDADNYRLNAEGKVEKYSAVYKKTVKITVYEVVDTSAKTEFAFGSNGFRKETANNLTYVMPNVNATVDSNTAGIGVTTVGGVNIYYPIVSMHKSGSSSWYNYFSVFEAVTITDLNGTVYNTSTTEMPSGVTVIGGFILDANGNISTAESANGTGIFNYSTGKEIKYATYSSYGLCYYPDSQFSKSTNSRDEQTIVVKYRYTDSNGTPYYYYVGYWCEKHTKSSTCVTPDTLVTLADGTQKRIDQVTYEDQLLVWNFYTGKYDVAPASIVMNHGYGNYTIVTLKFDDGTEVNTINGHGFFDTATNQYVILGEDNVADHIGHAFVKVDGDGYSTVKLVDYSIKTEYTESWSVLTAEHYNCILENLWTLTPAEVEGSPDYLMPFYIGEDMKYDEAKMQADIAKYGLYTYEEFAQYMTYEQFAALGIANFKVAVGKGAFQYEDILYLIGIHLG